jgi:hypothetical protein
MKRSQSGHCWQREPELVARLLQGRSTFLYTPDKVEIISKTVSELHGELLA